ncbi:hypothetical protein RRG08_031651, partial [Elysia crispata]
MQNVAFTAKGDHIVWTWVEQITRGKYELVCRDIKPHKKKCVIVFNNPWKGKDKSSNAGRNEITKRNK